MGRLAISKILKKRHRRNRTNPMQRLAKKANSSDDSGFTLIEFVAVMAMVAFLSTIAGVSWLVFINNQRLGTANDAIFRAMREAQSEARLRKLEWQVSFRESSSGGDGIVQWAVHKPGITIPADSPLWNDSEGKITIDGTNTNLVMADVDGDGSDDWRIKFDQFGGVSEPEEIDETNPPRITIMSTTSGTSKRCVVIRTLLGSMQTEQDDNCSP